jgi:hypothetical protein
MQFQAVDDQLALAQDRFVLPCVTPGQFLRKDVPDMAAQHFPFLAQPATPDQGLIGRHAAPGTILDKENDFGNMIEMLLFHKH